MMEAGVVYISIPKLEKQRQEHPRACCPPSLLNQQVPGSVRDIASYVKTWTSEYIQHPAVCVSGPVNSWQYYSE